MGALTGGAAGAAGAAVASSAAETLNQWEGKITDTLTGSGMPVGADNGIAKAPTGVLAGGVGFTAGGTAGAVAGLNEDFNNRQLHQLEKDKLAKLKREKTAEEQQRLEDAACALVRCSAGLRDDDPSKAAKLQSEQRGQAYVTEQKLLVSEGAFTYSVADAKLDQLNRVDVRNRGGLTVEEESNRQLALKACATDTRCASGVNDYYTNLKSERAERTLSVVNAIKVLEL